MGYKRLCVNYRKINNISTNSEQMRHNICPFCKKPVTLMSHMFRPPKKDNDKKWQVVEFLINQGFFYQRIYSVINEAGGYENAVKYPDNMTEAKEFVQKYKTQSLKNR